MPSDVRQVVYSICAELEKGQGKDLEMRELNDT